MKSILLRVPLVPAAGLMLASSILAPVPSWAQAPAEAAPPEAGQSGAWWELPSMFVTAQRTVADPVDVPYSADVVGMAEMERLQPRSTTEALRDLPSVMLQKTAYAQGSPYIRGFTGFRTLMLVDGIRLNNSTFRDGPNQYWTTVDSYALDRMELMRGPGSVLYGSDAIGGTVNGISKARAAYGPGFGWDGRTFYRYSTAENSHIGRAEFAGNAGESLGFNVGGTIKDYGDLRGGSDIGKMPQTAFNEADADARFEWRVDEKSQLVYGHQTVVQDDNWRTHATIYAKPWEGTAVGTDFERILDQKRNLDYLQYHASNLDGFADQVDASVSYQPQDERETRLRSNQRREYQGTDVDTLGMFLRLQSPSQIGQWLYGVEYYHDWVNSFFKDYNPNGALRSVRIQGPVADDSSYDLFGAYLEDVIPLAGERLELSAGGRYNYSFADLGKAQHPATSALMSYSDSWSALVGSGRLLWHVDDAKKWHVFGGVSQGFRAPNISDLSRFDIARSGEQEIPAVGLEPEDFVSVEGGVKTKQGRFAAEATYFHTFIQDMIVGVPTGGTLNGLRVVSKANSGEGNIHGVELTGQVDLWAGFLLWANYTWMEGLLDAPSVIGGPIVTEPVSRLMPSTVNYGLRWENDNHKYWAEFAGTVAGTQDRLSTGDTFDTQRIPPGGTPGYEVFHLRAGWRPCPKFSLTAALENLADADYRIHGSGVNEPGRNFIVAADLRF